MVGHLRHSPHADRAHTATFVQDAAPGHVEVNPTLMSSVYSQAGTVCNPFVHLVAKRGTPSLAGGWFRRGGAR